ncbi:MAG: hypothetical protein PHY95_02415 [Candidatus ainarchaeum sp.]|nr:hypothetical protein [Candidatus ainarchaeum sp.]
MNEKITEKMLEKWYSGFRNPVPSKSVSIRNLILSVENGVVSAKNPKANAFSILEPKDFGIDWTISGNALLLHSPSADADYVYLLDPGSKKAIRLDLYFEGDYFGFYSKDYALPFSLSRDFCASAQGESLLIVDCGKGKYAFTNKNGERVSARLKIRECLGCAVFGPEGGIACDSGRIFAFVGGKRAEIDLGEITGEKFAHPVFGFGKSKNYEWAAVKDKEWNFSILICMEGKECFSYTRFPVSALKGRAPL